ncbi:hypothetical protein Tco_0685841 [Tanacetum coccineum]
MSTSATSIRRRRVIPTHCQCNMPLVRRVAWTDTNPCRRFLNCRFSNYSSLWTRVIKAIHGANGKVDAITRAGKRSCWLNIIHEVKVLLNRGIDLHEISCALNYGGWGEYVILGRIVGAYEDSFRRITERRDVSIASIQRDGGTWCVLCDKGVETSNHLFFSCCLARQVSRLIIRWWDVPEVVFESYEGWLSWLVNLRLPHKNKLLLEGVFYVMWWFLWISRNKIIFESKAPLKATFFDNVVYDVVFMEHWSDSNINIIVQVLDYFFRASDLRINMQKSKLMGIAVDDDKVTQIANSISCMTFTTPFSYLGVKVRGLMSRTQAWDGIVNKLLARLSKWKMKTLYIGGRLTLIKLVLVYALKTSKNITLAHKLAQDNVGVSLRRCPRGGMEFEQFTSLMASLEGYTLPEI